MDDLALMEVIDRLRNRFFGMYRGIVTDVDATTMRIKANVPAVLADQPTGGAERASRLPGRTSAWRSCRRSGRASGSNSRAATSPIRFGPAASGAMARRPGDAAPAVKVIVTKSGHKILLDDAGRKSRSPISNNNVITLAADGITLQRGGNQIAIGDSRGEHQRRRAGDPSDAQLC